MQTNDELAAHNHMLPIDDGTAVDEGVVAEFDEITLDLNVRNRLLGWVGEESLPNGFGRHKDSITKEGGGEPMNIMQPYLVVSVWKRTA